MIKRVIVCSAAWLCIALACFAQESGVHTYRGFPVYPPGRAYSYERSRVGSFTIRLIPQEELSDVSPEELEAFKQEITTTAGYIESNAVSLGWQVAEKTSNIETGDCAFVFTKAGEEGAQKVGVAIRAGKPFDQNGRTRLPEDYGSIQYIFQGISESSSSPSS